MAWRIGYFPSQQQMDDVVIKRDLVKEEFDRMFEQPKPRPHVIGGTLNTMSLDTTELERGLRQARKAISEFTRAVRRAKRANGK